MKKETNKELADINNTAGHARPVLDHVICVQWLHKVMCLVVLDCRLHTKLSLLQ